MFFDHFKNEALAKEAFNDISHIADMSRILNRIKSKFDHPSKKQRLMEECVTIDSDTDDSENNSEVNEINKVNEVNEINEKQSSGCSVVACLLAMPRVQGSIPTGSHF